MRILHTSDWHLGAEYFQRSRFDEQAAFLDWLLATVEAHAVDVVVVAGDVFDTGSPSAEALRLYYAFLAELGRRGRRHAIVIGGNHDSASRLDAPRDVLSALSTTVVGGYAADRPEADLNDPAGVLVPIREGGEVRLVVAAVPYLHDWRLGVRGVDAEQAAQRQSLSDAFRAVYSRLADRASRAFPEATLMATGHLTCLSQAGLKPSAEDAIPVEINRVGTLGAMGPEIFDERFAYVALGHIHRGFSVDRAGRVRYSGTPVQVGAAEKADDRRVLLVDFAPGAGGPEVTSLPVPTRRRLVTLSGDYDEVAERLRTLSWAETELPPYVVLEARRTTFELGAQDRLVRLAPSGPGGTAVVVETRIPLEAPGGVSARAVGDLPLGTSITPEAAFRFAWDTRNRGVELTEPVLQRFRSLLEAGAGQD